MRDSQQPSLSNQVISFLKAIHPFEVPRLTEARLQPPKPLQNSTLKKNTIPCPFSKPSFVLIMKLGKNI